MSKKDGIAELCIELFLFFEFCTNPFKRVLHFYWIYLDKILYKR